MTGSRILFILFIIGFSNSGCHTSKFISYLKKTSTDTSIAYAKLSTITGDALYDIYNYCKKDFELDGEAPSTIQSASIGDCKIIPFSCFKFNWPHENSKLGTKNMEKYLVEDSMYFFYLIQYGDSIAGFSSILKNRKDGEWKFKEYIPNFDASTNYYSTYGKALSLSRKYASNKVFYIRYEGNKPAFGFFHKNKLKVVTFRFGNIALHENFNNWANSLRKIFYD